ncbi:MAG: hypothetical protein K8M05_36740, partial [Deltaproteobacteria bacterium]|nr:hypothetical protein [Kofleriaceae bacterium]
MWTDRSSPTFLLVIAASIVVHVASLAAMPAAERVTVIAQRPTTVAFETVSPAPPPAPPPPP